MRLRSLVAQGWRQTWAFASPNSGFLTNILSLAPSVVSDCSEQHENVSQYFFPTLPLPLSLWRMIAFAYAAPLPTPEDPPVHEGESLTNKIRLALACLALVWFIVVWLVCSLGYANIYRKYRKPQSSDLSLPESDLPFVTILRPIKGADPNLDLCLSSTCFLDYPKSRYELVMCVASPQDSAIPIIQSVMDAHTNVNTRIIIGEEDIGPNPKIRNLSKGYREANGDIVWILDCNVWVSPGTLSRSIRLLEGLDGKLPYKVVHHLPLCVDTTPGDHESGTPTSPLSPTEQPSAPLLGRVESPSRGSLSKRLSGFGGRLEESFLSSSHAKFYVAINTLAVAPCVVGKSSMFRRSQLAEVTRGPHGERDREGIVYFSHNICEDHLIPEKLWMTPLEEEKVGREKWGKHILGSDVVFQPTEFMSVSDYLARRTRWIRVRKYSTLAATLLEPATESLLCSLIGAYAFTTVPFLNSICGSSWRTFWVFWAIAVCGWALGDRLLFNFLHQYKCVIPDQNSPQFIREKKGRPLYIWAAQWLGREVFAPIVWLWAMWPGEVVWRGARYRIRWKDLKVEEIAPAGKID